MLRLCARSTYTYMSPALLACRQQIVFAYEELALTPAQIASQFEEYGFSEEEILTLLSSHSKKYVALLAARTETQTRGGGTKEELDELLAEYRLLSKISENDLVKERALKFLINEKKGRNDLPARGLALKERAIGIQEVNTAQKAREFIDIMKQINERLQQATTNTLQTPKPVLELTS